MTSTTLFPGFLSQALTYGFRIGNDQIPGRPDIESLINRDSSTPLLVDPWSVAQSLEALRGRPSAPPILSQVLSGDPERFVRSLPPSNDQRLSAANDSDPSDDKKDELSIVGPYRDQGLARPERLQMFIGGSLENRFNAVEAFEKPTLDVNVEQNIKTLLDFIQRPDSPKPKISTPMTVSELLKGGRARSRLQWLGSQLRPYKIKPEDMNDVLLRSRALAAILQLLRRGEVWDKKSLLAEILPICLSHPKKIFLVHLEEDWPASDPYRIAPYLIDLDRPVRLLLAHILQELTRGLNFDRKNLKDNELRILLDQARLILQEKESAIQEYLRDYERKPHQLSDLERFRRDHPIALMAFTLPLIITGMWFLAEPLIFSSDRTQLTTFLQKYRKFYLRLGVEPAERSLTQSTDPKSRL
jgi:hypothetical protein